MTALTVTAHLAAGVAFDSEWPPTLDGLLAAELWQHHKAALRDTGNPFPGLANTPNPPDLDLPLARCEITDADSPNTGDWHWAATCGNPAPIAAASNLDVTYIVSSLDQRHTALTADHLPNRLPAHKGRYRARRLPLVTTLTPTLTWHAVGHEEAVRHILEPVTAIGKKRAYGHGEVTAWNIQPSRRARTRAAHLHADDSLGRPAFPECLTQFTDTPPARTGTTTIRPPYIHESRRRHEIALPQPVR